MSKEIVLFSQPRYVPGGKEETSIFRKFIDTASFGGANKLEQIGNSQFGTKRVSTFLETFREYTESGVTAALLGIAHGSGNIAPGGVPLDASAALVGGIGRLIAGADSGIGKTMGDVGMTGNSIYWFRMASEWQRAKRKSGVHGDYSPPSPGEDVDIGDDPVVQAAQSI